MRDDGSWAAVHPSGALDEKRLWCCLPALRRQGEPEYLLPGENNAKSLNGQARASMKAEPAASRVYSPRADSHANGTFVHTLRETRTKRKRLLDVAPNRSAPIPGDMKGKLGVQRAGRSEESPFARIPKLKRARKLDRQPTDLNRAFRAGGNRKQQKTSATAVIMYEQTIAGATQVGVRRDDVNTSLVYPDRIEPFKWPKDCPN